VSRRIAVTGVASGIGQAVAAQLSEQDDTVIGIDLKDDDVCADLSGAAGRSEAVTAVRERCGGVLDGLVTCAGISEPDPATIAVNFFGTAALVEGLRSELAAATAPRVAAVASIAGTQPFDPSTVDACLVGDEDDALARARSAVDRGDGGRLYPSSKVAVARWLRSTCVAPGWADAGIAVNAVAPGVVLTPMTAPLLEDERRRAAAEKAVPMPLHGFARPEVIARALCWLASADTTHITGQVLYVDGGAEVTLRGPEVS
jgi:NAD(P)-dependent dehydrogenase (short-subunit alcohol dehydrogenase family)